MANVKQVIAIRTDLNMRKGKMVAQGCHCSMKVFFDRFNYFNRIGEDPAYIDMSLTPAMEEWYRGAFTKVVVGVDSEEAIYDLAKKAEELNIPHAVIIDNGFTEFHGNKTTTCIAIGPEYSEKIDQITKDLKLI
jgi:PTH2 family peptidyl-tRNA hydrolase